MAHVEQQQFCKSVQNKFSDFFKNKFVLDIGSFDINGNNQEYFDNSNYIGVDIASGRNVDIISKGHELGFPDKTFDIIISTECFEHDQYYEKTIRNIYRMLKDGGLFIFSCATIGRPEHGTRRTTPEDAPFLQSNIEWSDYYKNLTEEDIRKVLDIDNEFSLFEFSTNEISCDLYYYGFKKGIHVNRDDYSFLINKESKIYRNFIQLFIEDGNGLSEENSIKLPIFQNNISQEIEFDLKDKRSIQGFRLDPLNDFCVIEIESIKIVSVTKEEEIVNYISSNCIFNQGKQYFFDTEDSNIHFEGLGEYSFENVDKLIVILRFIHIGKNALDASLKQTKIELVQSKTELDQIKIELDQTKIELDQTKTELENIYISKSWKITKPLRSIFEITRKLIKGK